MTFLRTLATAFAEFVVLVGMLFGFPLLIVVLAAKWDLL